MNNQDPQQERARIIHKHNHKKSISTFTKEELINELYDRDGILKIIATKDNAFSINIDFKKIYDEYGPVTILVIKK